MRRILLSMLLVCVSLPAIAAKNELRLGVMTASRYDDNIRNVSEGKTDAFVFQLGPRIQFDSAASRYEAGFHYGPRFTYYTRGPDDDVTHSFGAHADYRPTPRLVFKMRDSLLLEYDADRDFSQVAEFDLDNGGDKKTFLNSLAADARYAVTQRFSLVSNFVYTSIFREDKDLTDSEQLSGRVQGEYVIGQRDTVGAGLFARNQVTEGGRSQTLGDIGDTTTNFYGFFLSWNHRFTPLVSANATGGPTWLVSNREDDGKRSATSVEYFTSAGLTAQFDGGSASVSYRRSNSEYARTASSFLTDSVKLRADWPINRRLVFRVSGEWNRRTAILKVVGADMEDKVIQWRAAATVSYRLTRETVSHFTVDYLRQDETVPGQTETKPSDRIRAVIRLNYNARTFRF